MPLTDAQRERVIVAAVELLKHPHHRRLLKILEQRLARETYADQEERDLDRVTYAVARAIQEKLEE